MDAVLSKEILKKISEKTKNEKNQKEFILEILNEECKGLGWYNKFYLEKLDKYAIKEK